MFVPGYKARWLHLTVYAVNVYQGQAVTHVCVLTAILYAFSLLLPLSYIQCTTLAVNNGDGSIESDYT